MAANSILKLKVETEEYDNKLKKAAEGIRHLADVAHKSGGELTGLEKAELDYIKALGDMETKSKTAAGSTRELESVFKELTVIYNQLNDVEKADEGGKALAASLETIKQRAIDARAQLDVASKSLQDNESAAQQNSSILEQLSSKFTVNIDALKLFNMGLTAAGAALDVAKDAFFASESTVDEWGRVMEESRGLYEGFLNAINNGDISGYLNNINEIIQAARDAYNELDKLGTMKTIQAPQISAQQTENERLRMMIQTGRYIAPVDGRKASMQNGQLLTADQITRIKGMLQNGLNNVVSLVGNEVKQTGRAIDAYYNKLAKENGMSLQDFKKGTSSWEEFSKKMQGYEDYKRWDAQARTEFAKQGGRGNVDFDKSNPFVQYRKWGTFRVDKMGENSFNDLVRLIQQRDQQAGQAYSMQSQAYRGMNRVDGVTVRGIMGGGSGGSGGGGRTTTRSAQLTTAQQTEVDIEKAQKAYADAINEAKVKVEEGIMTEDDQDKAIYSAKEQLSNAYLKAYNATGDSKYLEAQKEVAESMVFMKGVIEQSAQEQKQLEQQTRELNEQEKKISDATEELYQAMKDGDLKGFYAASKKLKSAGGEDVSYKGTVKATQENMSALTAHLREGLGKAEVGSADFSSLSANLVDVNTLQSIINAQIKNGLSIDPETTKSLMSQIINGDNIDDSVWQGLQDKINEQLKAMGIEPVKIDFKTGNIVETGKQTEKSWKAAAGAMSSVNSALQQMEDPSAKIVGIVGQAIANIALGFAQATASDSKLGVFGWIAAIAGGMATMLSTISAIHNATGYQYGGMVKGYAQGGAVGGVVQGTTYSGDQIPIMANAGEVVLTRAMAGNLASQLDGEGAFNNLELTTVIGAEDIKLVLNNRGRRTGKGEYVQSKFRRS